LIERDPKVAKAMRLEALVNDTELEVSAPNTEKAAPKKYDDPLDAFLGGDDDPLDTYLKTKTETMDDPLDEILNYLEDPLNATFEDENSEKSDDRINATPRSKAFAEKKESKMITGDVNYLDLLNEMINSKDEKVSSDKSDETKKEPGKAEEVNYLEMLYNMINTEPNETKGQNFADEPPLPAKDRRPLSVEPPIPSKSKNPKIPEKTQQQSELDIFDILGEIMDQASVPETQTGKDIRPVSKPRPLSKLGALEDTITALELSIAEDAELVAKEKKKFNEDDKKRKDLEEEKMRREIEEQLRKQQEADRARVETEERLKREKEREEELARRRKAEEELQREIDQRRQLEEQRLEEERRKIEEERKKAETQRKQIEADRKRLEEERKKAEAELRQVEEERKRKIEEERRIEEERIIQEKKAI